MRFINELHEGDRLNGIYLCKQKQAATTKNGKPYENVILQDKTGMLDGKIWDPNSLGIDDFDALDYIEVVGDVTTFAGAMQLNIKRVRKAHEGEYNPADYLPVSENSTDDMYGQIIGMIKSVKNEYLSALLNKLFVEDKEFLKSFQEHSAAKTVHHGFIGGLMEHTLSVTKLCDYMANAYPLLKRDLLITASLLHDVGKTKELSSFPMKDSFWDISSSVPRWCMIWQKRSRISRKHWKISWYTASWHITANWNTVLRRNRHLQRQ